MEEELEGIKNATVRAYLLKLPEAERASILRSKEKLQDLEQRVAKSQATLGQKLMEEERQDNSKKELEAMVDLYYKSTTMPRTAFEQNYGSEFRQSDVECEVRFGTNRKSARAFSKLDYDKVVQQFQQAGFKTDQPEGMHLLRINSEYYNTKQQRHVFSSIRAEICGLDLVQQYARSNNLPKLMQQHKMDDEYGGLDLKKVKFTQKRAPDLKGQGRLKPVEFPDFNFRVSYQMEKNLMPTESDAVQSMMSHWVNSKKTFRYLNRVRFSHPKHPVFLDVSIVKSSASEMNKTTKQRVPIPEYTLQDAHVFENAETYEIELELDNARMDTATTTVASVLASVRHCIRLVLSGLQGTAFPIGFAERNQVLVDYLALIHGRPKEDPGETTRRVTSHHFIGPNPTTLQLEHIQAATTTSIRENYSVTDKADGERKLLFVSPTNGKVYMLDTTMNVVFTGCVVKEEKQWNSLLDGEHIKRNREGQAMNKYKAFDIYYWSGKSKRELAFYEPYVEKEPKEGNDTKKEKMDEYEERLRLPLMKKWIRNVEWVAESSKGKTAATATTAAKSTDFTVEAKTFLTTYEMDIFQACHEIWEAIQHPAYEYETDGLIFTPTHTGVGADRVGQAGPLHKFTWKSALKWKPPHQNTVDFLVRIKHDATSSHDVHAIYKPGQDLTRAHSVEYYKTLTLCCGFNPRDHGYLHPQKMMLEDEMPLLGSGDREEDYLPCAFEPSDPADPDAHICDWTTKEQGNGEHVLMTEEGEYFDEDMIVEFRYDRFEENTRRRWIPLRVRYDKTNELRMGYKNYGNAFHVAESNWRSIWYEITSDMITTGRDIPVSVQDDVYYNRVGDTNDTRGLRQFHNHYVKRRMIQGLALTGDTLLDLGVGKAGDLRKWADAKLSFVWGIDLSQDNIENRKDGACARYMGCLRLSQTHSASASQSALPKAIFQQGNVEMNLRTGEAFALAKDKKIAQALFGKGAKDKTELGLNVYNHYGAAERGFQVTSCQFAVHYFFKDATTLHSFLRNVAECTREQGYFLCTCFDGNLVFDKLRHLVKGMKFEIRAAAPRDNHKIFEITKQYDESDFVEDETSLGYGIDVYQDTINTSNREYLVNFGYFKRVMENYGFVLLDEAEAKGSGFVAGTGLFRELHAQLVEQSQEDKTLASTMERALHMTPAEQTISFLNRYYLFKKVRTVSDLPSGKEKEEDAKKTHPAKKEEDDSDKPSLPHGKKGKFRRVKDVIKVTL